MLSKTLNVLFWIALVFGFLVSMITISSMPVITGTGILATFIAALTIPGIVYTIKFFVDKNETDSQEETLRDSNNSNARKSASNYASQKQKTDLHFQNASNTESCDPRFCYMKEDDAKNKNAVTSGESGQVNNSQEPLDPRFGYSIPEESQRENKIEIVPEKDEDEKKIQLIEESIKMGILSASEAERMFNKIKEARREKEEKESAEKDQVKLLEQQRERKEELQRKFIQLDKLLEEDIITSEEYFEKRTELDSRPSVIAGVSRDFLIQSVFRSKSRESYSTSNGYVSIANIGDNADNESTYVTIDGDIAQDGKYQLGSDWFVHVRDGKFVKYTTI